MAQTLKIERIRLIDMMRHEEYFGLAEGLVQFIVPDRLRIGRRKYPVPQSRDEFMSAICYGQRLFFGREEKNDYGVIIRMIDGYYYPLVSGKKWDEDRALLFGKNVLNCRVQELYPVANHLVTLLSAMIDREKTLLYREPSKIELAAGVEKLNVFAELSALNFLRDTMKITTEEVLLQPYNECLVRFMMEKERQEYLERYTKLLNEEAQAKHGRPKT